MIGAADQKPSVRLAWRLFLGALALTVALDLFVTHHPYFGLDGTFGFHAWYGFVACVVLVVVAKGLGLLIQRHDEYYDA